MKTCSVRVPGRTAAASGSLGPGSGTSVASVASSVDCEGLAFPLAMAATSPVGGGVSLGWAKTGVLCGVTPSPALTLALVQHRGVPAGGAAAVWHVAARGTAHQGDAGQNAVGARVLWVHITVQEHLPWRVVAVAGSWGHGPVNAQEPSACKATPAAQGTASRPLPELPTALRVVGQARRPPLHPSLPLCAPLGSPGMLEMHSTCALHTVNWSTTVPGWLASMMTTLLVVKVLVRTHTLLDMVSASGSSFAWGAGRGLAGLAGLAPAPRAAEPRFWALMSLVPGMALLPKGRLCPAHPWASGSPHSSGQRRAAACSPRPPPAAR